MKILFTIFVIMNTASAFRIPVRKNHFSLTNFMETEINADTIITTRILDHAVKRKIFSEVANDGDILQTFDSFNPLYVVVLIVSSIYSSDIKYNNKIMKLQKKIQNQSTGGWILRCWLLSLL
jgi:hypothetical protein